MKIIPAFLAATMLLTVHANAWEITIKGEGKLPNIETVQPQNPPPIPAPLPPPPVVPPVIDTTPFDFPIVQPGQDITGEARYWNLCFDGCYAGLPKYDNPLRVSHLFACFLPMGMIFEHASMGGFRLYVPKDMKPSLIRTLCAGGSL